MSVDKNEMLFEVGDLYINDVRIGNLKNATFTYTKEFQDGKPGDGINIVRRDMTGEMATIAGTLCDFNIARLLPIFGVTTSVSQLTNTTTLRVVEEFGAGDLSVSAGKTLAEQPVSITNVKVWTPDYKTEYTQATAYTMTLNFAGSLSCQIFSKGASTTMAANGALVEYDYIDASALNVDIGGKTTHEEKKLKFVHKMADGKHVQITIPKAQMTGEISLPFLEEGYLEIPVSFTAVGDMSKAKGKRLVSITKER